MANYVVYITNQVNKIIAAKAAPPILFFYENVLRSLMMLHSTR